MGNCLALTLHGFPELSGPPFAPKRSPRTPKLSGAARRESGDRGHPDANLWVFRHQSGGKSAKQVEDSSQGTEEEHI